MTLEELQEAPEKVKDLPMTISPEFIETTTITDEQLMLAGHHIKEGALTQKYLNPTPKKLKQICCGRKYF